MSILLTLRALSSAQIFSDFRELKGLMISAKGLVLVGFLDTIFLFLIYTEVGAVGRFIPRSAPFYLAGVERVDSITLGCFPTSTQFYS
ncbi:MAG: hypothetical protein NPIRA03_15670 [Nitrospirales bacterium]|nr:MAG: hypothetical protein NPIRA03_15670 [Nitrospirales bacterium]